MHTLDIDAKELKQYIERKLKHAYIDKYIKQPFIDEDKMNLLNYLYDNVQLSVAEKHKYITTIMLVQIALDTHELVPNDQTSEASETEKQLSVLAGDYYSGLYYFFLSELEDIKMVQVLGKAIRQINEQKMTLFYVDKNAFSDILVSLESIESALYTQAAEYIHTDKKMLPIIQKYLLINRLKREQQKLEAKQSSYIAKWTAPLFSQAQLIEEINLAIDAKESEIIGLLNDLPYQYYNMSKMIRQRLQLTYHISIAEEG